MQIRGGTLSITASDDGINAGRKSGAYEPTVDIQGGDITISVLLDESDAIDANGNILISGGTIRITATGAFDCDGQAVLTGGTVIVNGVEVTTLQIRKN